MIYQYECDTLEVQEPIQYTEDYDDQHLSVEVKTDVGYIRQSHLRDANGNKLRNINGHLQCGKLQKNLFYASGKYVSFSVDCNNTRMCPKCRDKMINRKLDAMKGYGDDVPLYKHEIDPKEWDAWRKWYSRKKTPGDRYWQFPTSNNTLVIVSTLKRYRDTPILENKEAQVRKWIELERHSSKNASSSAVMKNCSNPECEILYSSHRKQCPECGTEYVKPVPQESDDELVAEISMKDEDIQRLFKRALVANGVTAQKGMWEVSEDALNGKTRGQFLSDIAKSVYRMSQV